MILQLICLKCIVFIVACLFHRYCRSGRLMAKIPGPMKLPLFGNMLAMYKTPEDLFISFRHWHKKHGRIWQLSGFHVRTIHLCEPDDMEIIFSSSRHNRKEMPYTFLYGWLGRGLLVSNGDKWHHRRKMLTPAFHFKILKKYINTFCEHTQVLLETLKKEADKEKTDLIPLINKTALRIMCETSMGTKLKDTPAVDKYFEAVHRIGECIVQRLIRPWYIVNTLYMLSKYSRREKSILPDLHNFTKQMIRDKRKSRKVINAIKFDDDTLSGKKIMLDLLLDEEKKGRIDDDGIREEVDTFLFEGHDTTATALYFMIMRIANEPEIQDRIYDELEGIFGDSEKQPGIQDLNNMKFLECCIKESLRLYPSVPFLSRYLAEEVIIAGYRIPKDTYCDIHVYDIHRNPEVYPDPEKFIPERFLLENMAKRNPYTYIPFSAGPRNCIGQKFAIMEMKTVMSGILRKFRLEPITRPEDVVFTVDLVLRTKHPIYVRFCRRK